jgi:hypothetical protein
MTILPTFHAVMKSSLSDNSKTLSAPWALHWYFSFYATIKPSVPVLFLSPRKGLDVRVWIHPMLFRVIFLFVSARQSPSKKSSLPVTVCHSPFSYFSPITASAIRVIAFRNVGSALSTTHLLAAHSLDA